MNKLTRSFQRQASIFSDKSSGSKKGESSQQKRTANPDAADVDEMSHKSHTDSGGHPAEAAPKAALAQGLKTPNPASHAPAHHAQHEPIDEHVSQEDDLTPETIDNTLENRPEPRSVDEVQEAYKKESVPARQKPIRVRFAEGGDAFAVAVPLRDMKIDAQSSASERTMVSMYQAAIKSQVPIYSASDALMVWPSGQMYKGRFSKEGLPETTGQVTLANGKGFSSDWHKGRCLRLKNATSGVTAADVNAVTAFKKHSASVLNKLFGA